MNDDVTYTGVQTFGGGFDIGAVQAGLKLATRIELPGGYGLPMCEANRHILGDFKSVVAPWTEWADAGSTEIVLSNPPCSGFSLMSSAGFRGVNSSINHCMWANAEYVGRTAPQIFIQESVQQAYTGGVELMRQLRARVEEISGLRYDLHHVMHDAAVLGNCAIRKRYFMVMSRVPFNVGWDPATPRTHLRDVIGDLVGVPCSLTPAWEGGPDGHDYKRALLVKRVIELMHAVEWNEGEYLAYVLTRAYKKDGVIPGWWGEDHMRKKIMAAPRNGPQEVFGSLGFHQPTRWAMDAHGRVVTGGTPVLGYHPTEHRPLTLRECARILGYPDDFTLRAHWERASGHMVLGKGVCVEAGRWIADAAKHAVLGTKPDGDVVPSVETGDREYLYRADRLRKHEYAAKTLGRVGIGVK